MKRRLRWILISAGLLPLGCDGGLRETVTGPEAKLERGPAAASIHSCDANYVSRRRATITVLPAGSDDTRNLQCAFDAARAGDVVQLAAGEYHTAQIAVAHFRGTFRGRGAERTIIYNRPDLVVTAQDLFNTTPGPGNTFPSLFAFWESNLTVSNLAIRIIGENPTTGWTIFGLNLRELAHAILVIGRTGHVRVVDVLVEGQEAPGTLIGTNVISGVYTEGMLGGNPGTLSGSFIVEGSTFRTMGDPFPFSAVDGFRARFTHNRVEGVLGVSAGDLVNSSVVYKDNTIESVLGIWLYNAGLLPYGIQASSMLVRNNRFSGDWGVFFEATFGPDVRCRLVGNNTTQTQNGLYLGAGESVCDVIGLDGARRLERRRPDVVGKLVAPFKAFRNRAEKARAPGGTVD